VEALITTVCSRRLAGTEVQEGHLQHVPPVCLWDTRSIPLAPWRAWRCGSVGECEQTASGAFTTASISVELI